MPKIKYPYEFDPKKRKIAQEYRNGRLVIFFIGLVLSFLVPLAVLSSGLHLTLRDFALQFPFSTLVYGFLILSAFTILQLPLTFYTGYIYEHKFKLSNYTLAGWFKDFLKMSLVAFTIGLILISILYYSIRTFSTWWIYAGIMYILFSATMNYIFPLVIVPFMWKTKPYKDRSMKNKILNLCRRLGVMNIKNVVMINESEKSVRPNAVFMGFGNSKRMGLFDTMLKSFSRNEIETVVGHELGHYVNKDILRGLILESILVIPTLFAIDYFVKSFGPTFGIPDIADLSSLVLIGLIYGVLEFFIMPIGNTFSRWREAQADLFALEHIRKPQAQISTEKRLADMHLAELSTHPLTEFWLFSHPSTIKRIKMAEQWNKRKKNNL